MFVSLRHRALHYKLLLALVAGLLLVLAACSGQTALVFENETVCGTIQVELTNSQTGITETYDVPVGETVVVEVVPNVTYRYVVDYSVAENEAGYVCDAIHRGQVTAPTGTSQTFNLTAVTPTPDTSAE